MALIAVSLIIIDGVKHAVQLEAVVVVDAAVVAVWQKVHRVQVNIARPLFSFVPVEQLEILPRIDATCLVLRLCVGEQKPVGVRPIHCRSWVVV